MTDLELVKVLADQWHLWSQEDDFPFSPDHCVNGTRVATLTLARFDVAARPVSVQFVLFNSFAKELYDQGHAWHEWPPHAWSVGVGPPGDSLHEGDRWNGHLVCEGVGWTLDVSAMQFNRPGLIVVDGPFLLPANLPPTPEWDTYVDSHRQHLAIARWPENNAWRQASGWKRLHAAECTELARRVLRAIEKGNTDDNDGHRDDHADQAAQRADTGQ